MVRYVVLLLASLSILSGPVWAQVPVDAVLVRDATGDTGAMGAPIPAGADAFDLVEISIANENATLVEMRLRVVGVSGEPPAGEIGAHFKLNGSYWTVGWTTIAFPAPPFVYRGGFYCPSDAARAVDASKCDGFAARIAGNAYVITLDRATLGALGAGQVLEQARGYADVYNSDGTAIRVDETQPGVAYQFVTGTAPKNPGPARETTPEPLADSRVVSPVEDGSARETSGTPGLSTFALLIVLGLVAWTRRRT